MVKESYIKCEHPLDKVRVVWHIIKWGNSYKVEEPRAHCIQCNTSLHPIDKQAIFAIDLVMVKAGRLEKAAHDEVVA